jgi:hypothetical protein
MRMALARIPKTSAAGLKRPKGKPSERSRMKKSNIKPVTPRAPQHNHFSIANPFTACMGDSGYAKSVE